MPVISVRTMRIPPVEDLTSANINETKVENVLPPRVNQEINPSVPRSLPQQRPPRRKGGCGCGR
jgi:hypothetical protein